MRPFDMDHHIKHMSGGSFVNGAINQFDGELQSRARRTWIGTKEVYVAIATITAIFTDQEIAKIVEYYGLLSWHRVELRQTRCNEYTLYLFPNEESLKLIDFPT